MAFSAHFETWNSILSSDLGKLGCPIGSGPFGPGWGGMAFVLVLDGEPPWEVALEKTDVAMVATPAGVVDPLVAGLGSLVVEWGVHCLA